MHSPSHSVDILVRGLITANQLLSLVCSSILVRLQALLQAISLQPHLVETTKESDQPTERTESDQRTDPPLTVVECKLHIDDIEDICTQMHQCLDMLNPQTAMTERVRSKMLLAYDAIVEFSGTVQRDMKVRPPMRA